MQNPKSLHSTADSCYSRAGKLVSLSVSHDPGVGCRPGPPFAQTPMLGVALHT